VTYQSGVMLPISATMGWLRLVGSLKLYVSFAGHSLFYRALLQKRPKFLRSLLVIATPYPYYHDTQIRFITCYYTRESVLPRFYSENLNSLFISVFRPTVNRNQLTRCIVWMDTVSFIGLFCKRDLNFFFSSHCQS